MTKPAFKPKRILWVDLEMTGLSPRDDVILEVAAIVTDWDFKELATYEGVVQHDIAALSEKLAANAVFWDENPEARDGLLEQNMRGKALDVIEGELLAFIYEHFDEGPVLLGGNSIHQDRKFIEQWWPRVNNRLHYRMLDVSAWKVVMEGKYKKKFAKPESHRALEDIRGSIEELKYYLKKVKV
ncbi:MAG: oligoribonuclease [Candidatus Saccharibacteria bacterium]|jgi:oligoribonuclease|nr:oligoribonuclease [Candidatus Saccharibacteria bacterium]